MTEVLALSACRRPQLTRSRGCGNRGPRFRGAYTPASGNANPPRLFGWRSLCHRAAVSDAPWRRAGTLSKLQSRSALPDAGRNRTSVVTCASQNRGSHRPVKDDAARDPERLRSCSKLSCLRDEGLKPLTRLSTRGEDLRHAHSLDLLRDTPSRAPRLRSSYRAAARDLSISRWWLKRRVRPNSATHVIKDEHPCSVWLPPS